MTSTDVRSERSESETNWSQMDRGTPAAAELPQALLVMKRLVALLYDIAAGLDGEMQEALERIAARLDEEQSELKFELAEAGHLASLTVPKDYIEAFRQGLLRELKFDGEWLASQSDEAKRSLAVRENPTWYPPHERPSGDFDPLECIGGPLTYCQVNAEYLRELDGKSDADVTLAGDPQMLKQAVQMAGHERAERHLLDVEYGSPESAKAATLVAWAATEAERLEAERIGHLDDAKAVGA